MQPGKGLETDRLRRIEGRHNSLLKELRQSFHRGELTAADECAIEGFRIIEEAIRSGLKLRAVFVSESGRERAARLLPQIGAHVDAVVVPDKLFASVVLSETPQGLAALVRLKTYAIDQVLDHAEEGPLVAIAGIQDPGNLGTIFRSAEAFGAKGVLLGEGTVSVYNSKVVRASAGSIFRVPFTRVEIKTAIAEMRSHGIRLLATSSHKGRPLPEVDLRSKASIFIGNEGAGIHKKLLSEMDELIMIPHSPRVESLNAGIAASIVLYEAARQKILFTTETRKHGETKADLC
ncbi:MAG TPA: RNA methyltransferase [Terriglobales bacterium]|nr:RNA methyltransferase [Terriglobales bacterium]